jgi:hypothetical protein
VLALFPFVCVLIIIRHTISSVDIVILLLIKLIERMSYMISRLLLASSLLLINSYSIPSIFARGTINSIREAFKSFFVFRTCLAGSKKRPRNCQSDGFVMKYVII